MSQTKLRELAREQLKDSRKLLAHVKKYPIRAGDDLTGSQASGHQVQRLNMAYRNLYRSIQFYHRIYRIPIPQRT